MAETEFGIEYRGPALADGRMPVRDLAPALLALGELFTEAATVVYPTRPPVSLDIKATEKGSFVVDLILSGGDAWETMVDLLDSEDINALVNLKELIVGGGVVGTGLFVLLKKLRGSAVVEEEPAENDGQVRLTTEDGTILTVPAEVAKLQRRTTIRRKVREVVQPLGKDGIDEVHVRTEQQEIVLEKDELPAFEIPETVEESPLGETEATLLVEIAAIAFTEGHKWKLTDGDANFFARIADEGFISRIDAGEPFRKGDRLRVVLRIEQAARGDELHTEREVIRVIEHIPAGEQLTLAPPDDAQAA